MKYDLFKKPKVGSKVIETESLNILNSKILHLNEDEFTSAQLGIKGILITFC